MGGCMHAEGGANRELEGGERAEWQLRGFVALALSFTTNPLAGLPYIRSSRAKMFPREALLIQNSNYGSILFLIYK